MYKSHWITGVYMGLFFRDEASPGQIYWLPEGLRVRKMLKELTRKCMSQKWVEVETPALYSDTIWKNSKHLTYYSKNMFSVLDSSKLYLKPMSCPAHLNVLKTLGCFNDIIRVFEWGRVYRREFSGAISSLLRMYVFTQDDGHIYTKHVKGTVLEILNMLRDSVSLYDKCNLKVKRLNLSVMPEDSEFSNGYFGTKILEVALRMMKIPYSVSMGEGAFYGSKIEIESHDANGRKWQLGTIQLEQRKIKGGFNFILHRAILGSLERFLGIILESSRGFLPIPIHPYGIVCTFLDNNNKWNVDMKSMLDRYLRGHYVVLNQLDSAVKITKKMNSRILLVVSGRDWQLGKIAIKIHSRKIFYISKERLVYMLKRISERLA